MWKDFISKISFARGWCWFYSYGLSFRHYRRVYQLNSISISTLINFFICKGIIDFVKSFQTKAIAAPNRNFWMFLDEINTCDHLGLISELICHRTMLGVPLPHNLCLIAACNPYFHSLWLNHLSLICFRYRLRTKQLKTSGLDGKIKWDDLSKLVYRYWTHHCKI